MPLTRAEVEYVAALARLGLNDAEITRLQNQLSSILEHIEAIDRLDRMRSADGTSIAMTNVMRSDVVIVRFRVRQCSKMRRAKTTGFFEVHAILGPARGRLAVPDSLRLVARTSPPLKRGERSIRVNLGSRIDGGLPRAHRAIRR